jgi:uroporphyrinogen-III decarboxylase
MPYDKLVFEQWKKEGALTSLHICGKSTSIWDYMVETRTHNIEVDQTVDLVFIRDEDLFSSHPVRQSLSRKEWEVCKLQPHIHHFR